METGGVFFLGLALTLVAVYLLAVPEGGPEGGRRRTWALILAAPFFALAALVLAAGGSLFGFVWPALLILAGHSPVGLINDWVIIPAALGSLLTGLMGSWLTPWGFFRHRWLTVKWIVTVTIVVGSAVITAPWDREMEAISRVEGITSLQNPVYLGVREAGGSDRVRQGRGSRGACRDLGVEAVEETGGSLASQAGILRQRWSVSCTFGQGARHARAPRSRGAIGPAWPNS